MISSRLTPATSSIASSTVSLRRAHLQSPPPKVKYQRLRSRPISCAVSGGASKGLTYKDAGVDIDAGTELVRRIAKMAPGIGGFGGLFPFGWYLILFLFFYRTYLCTF